jgi:hypothetical protein
VGTAGRDDRHQPRRRVDWRCGRRAPRAAAAARVAAIADGGRRLRGRQRAVTQPWNPYLPLLFWVVVLLATWSVLLTATTRCSWWSPVPDRSRRRRTCRTWGCALGMAGLASSWLVWRCSGTATRCSATTSPAIGRSARSCWPGCSCGAPVVVDQLRHTPRQPVEARRLLPRPARGAGGHRGRRAPRAAPPGRVAASCAGRSGSASATGARSCRRGSAWTAACRAGCPRAARVARLPWSSPSACGAGCCSRLHAVIGAALVLAVDVDEPHLRQGLVLPHAVGVVHDWSLLVASVLWTAAAAWRRGPGAPDGAAVSPAERRLGDLATRLPVRSLVVA